VIVISVPVIVSVIHGTILSKYEKGADWIMPIVVSIFTIFGIEFIVGNLGNYASNLFSGLTGNVINIKILWAFIAQFVIVYATFRVISLIIPARTLSMAITSTAYALFGLMHHLYETELGKSFLIKDLLEVKNSIALFKILLSRNGDVLFLCKAIAIIILLVIVAYLFSKKSSVYNFPTRIKSFLCGILVFAIGIYLSNSLYYAMGAKTTLRCDETYGYTYYMINNVDKQNKFSSALMEEIKKEADALFSAEEAEDEILENGVSPNEHDDFTVGDQAIVVPDNGGQEYDPYKDFTMGENQDIVINPDAEW
jgi:hypothetical protein